MVVTMIVKITNHLTHFNDDYGLLHDIIDLCLDEIEECADAPLCRLLHFDRTPSYRPDGLPHEINIHLCCIPLLINGKLRFT